MTTISVIIFNNLTPFLTSSAILEAHGRHLEFSARAGLQAVSECCVVTIGVVVGVSVLTGTVFSQLSGADHVYHCDTG